MEHTLLELFLIKIKVYGTHLTQVIVNQNQIQNIRAES